MSAWVAPLQAVLEPPSQVALERLAIREPAAARDEAARVVWTESNTAPKASRATQ